MSPATVIDGMHYVQLFHVVDPVVAQLDATANGSPPSAELRTAAGSLQQFAAQAHGLPSSGSVGRTTLDRLAVASSTLAGQFTTLAAKGTLSPGATQASPPRWRGTNRPRPPPAGLRGCQRS